MKKVEKLTSFDLKILGIILMFGDHFYDDFSGFGAPVWLTILGRSVAPIFLFLSSEGFHYTHSKFGYMKNLLIFFWITNIATMIVIKVFPNDSLVLINSMMGTLFLSVIAMWAWDGIKSFNKNRKYFYQSVFGWLFLIITPILSVIIISMYPNPLVAQVLLFIPNAITVEGGVIWIILGLLFYIFRENRIIQLSIIVIISALVFVLGNKIQFWMILSVIPIAMYNGLEGKKMKWLFYIFYPAHIVGLYIIATLIQ
ncbi:TraX family protein [Leuconostoc suionicum]|uniref:TraX family protein n=1 Tax=Leuconostoc suionicum TaxID=1511761 RepID=UPI0032DF1A95